MEHNMLGQMLELVDAPAFAAQGNEICAVNPAAGALMIAPGMKVGDLLADGIAEYEAFTVGVLSATVSLGKLRFSATIRCFPPYRIFRLETAEQPQVQALALAAQQLRGPLSDLMLGMSRLEEDPSFPRLNRSAHRLLRQVENMSDAGFYAEGTCTKETCNVSALVFEIAEKAAELFRQAGKTLEYRASEQNITCWLDRKLLEKCIYQLLANALKFSPAGGTVRLQLQINAKQFLLSVEDSGGGIPEQQMAGLFTRYTRTPTIEESRLGLGLGLALVQSFARNHDGSILLRNTERGLKAALSVPIREGKPKLRSRSILEGSSLADPALVALSESLPAEAFGKK